MRGCGAVPLQTLVRKEPWSSGAPGKALTAGLTTGFIQVQAECASIQQASETIVERHFSEQATSQVIFASGIFQKVGTGQTYNIENQQEVAVEAQVG